MLVPLEQYETNLHRTHFKGAVCRHPCAVHVSGGRSTTAAS